MAESKKKKIKKSVANANLVIKASFNNTSVSLSDMSGNVIAWASSGKLQFRGTRKATPYAATQVMSQIIEKMKDFNVKEVNVKTIGVGVGRESALRALGASSVVISSITDATPMAHNGPRRRKSRRV